MKDVRGIEITIGAQVVYVGREKYATPQFGTVLHMTPQRVEVDGLQPNSDRMLKKPGDIIIVNLPPYIKN